MNAKSVATRPPAKPSVALVLQGGGALGGLSYRRLPGDRGTGLHPDWVSGSLERAINAAIIAGNAPELPRGAADGVLAGDLLAGASPRRYAAEAFPMLHDWMSNAGALLLGQPNFFSPRPINPLLIAKAAPPDEVSFYDTTPLRATLREYADFARINRGAPRLSLGAAISSPGGFRFRQFQPSRPRDRTGTCARERLAAAGVPGDQGRLELVMGRRLREQHAARRDHRTAGASAHACDHARSLADGRESA